MTGLTMVQTLRIFRDSILIIAPVLNNLGNKRRGVVIITTAQLHSTKPELRFCAGSNPARGVSEIRDSEDLWQWSRLEIRLNAFRRSTIPQKQFIIIIIIIIIRVLDNNNTICLTENSIKVDLSSREPFILFLQLIFYHNFSTVTTIKYFSLRSIFC